jgi:hypothetical protein
VIKGGTKSQQALVGAMLVSWAMMLGACSNQTAPGSETKLEGQPPSGSVVMHQVQAAYIASGSGGGGDLYYQGRDYPFTVGGVGIGGIGASTIEARGDVYNLTRLLLGSRVMDCLYPTIARTRAPSRALPR